MSGKALSILGVLVLLCAPLAAQDTEDPIAQDPGYEEQYAPEDPALADEPMIETEVSAEADVQSDAVDEEATEELPRTASPLALLVLLGGAGVASGLGLRLRRK